MDKPRLPGFTGASSLYQHGHYPGIAQPPGQTRVLPQTCYQYVGDDGGRYSLCCDCPYPPFCQCYTNVHFPQ